MRAYEVAFADDHIPPLETFHALRIRCKHLRYVLEFTQHLLGSPGERLISQLRELQEHLGQLNDLHVEQERLSRWTKQIQEDSTLRTSIEARQTQIAALIAELTATFPPRFAGFIAAPNRKRLNTAIARL
jgi:CHAD domain-containing protein